MSYTLQTKPVSPDVLRGDLAKWTGVPVLTDPKFSVPKYSGIQDDRIGARDGSVSLLSKFDVVGGMGSDRNQDSVPIIKGNILSCWLRGSNSAESVAARENQVSIRRAFFRCARPPRALRGLSRGVQRSESRLADLQQ